MNKREFMTWFAEQVQTRWPTWQINGCILGDWFTAFGRYDAAVLTEAVRRHKIYDDPARPRTNRLLSLIREITTASVRKPSPTGCSANVVTWAQFWQIVRTSFSKSQRIRLMMSLAKFHPYARDKDPEAYDWAMAKGLLPTVEEPAPADEEAVRPVACATGDLWSKPVETGG